MIPPLADRFPVMTTPKWVRNKIQPIAARDALYYLVAAATADVPSSRTWDIGGPDVLPYGDMMRIYAGLARPLIESLECDAVMRNSDIDTIIKQPEGGLTGYRRAVELALNRAARGLPDAEWFSVESEPAEALPSDPGWAGEIVYTDVRSAMIPAAPDDVWAAAEK